MSGGFQGLSQESTPKQPKQIVEPRDLKAHPDPGGRVQVELVGTEELDHAARAELVDATRRFAVTFARWLYGDRREVTVEGIAPDLVEDLASAPPYLPAEQIGSEAGRAVQIQVFMQTERSGVLVVSIRDARTSYPVPARFERRAGRWQIVHLNNH
jgi:hypothetical protein